jgi:hypothetical protein
VLANQEEERMPTSGPRRNDRQVKRDLETTDDVQMLNGSAGTGTGSSNDYLNANSMDRSMMINGNAHGDGGKHNHTGMKASGSSLMINGNVGRGVDPSKISGERK